MAAAPSYGTFNPSQSQLEPGPSPSSGGSTSRMAGNAASASTSGKNVDENNARPSSKLDTVKAAFTSKDMLLLNVGSVARDHLANERTFLGWLRTSLALASIGVAITQLFRLSSAVYTLPGKDNGATSSAYTLPNPSSLPPVDQDNLATLVAALLLEVEQQSIQLARLGTSVKAERTRYHALGKPIGGTFIMLGVLFMLLGSHRYLSVQHHLVSKNYFPPARRSVVISSTCIGSLLISAFVAMLVIK